MRKLILLTGVIVGALLLGLNAQNLASLEFLSGTGLSEKLQLLSLDTNRTLVVFGGLILLLLILLKVNYSQHSHKKDLDAKIKSLGSKLESKVTKIEDLNAENKGLHEDMNELIDEVNSLKSDENRLEKVIEKFEILGSKVERNSSFIENMSSNNEQILNTTGNLVTTLSDTMSKVRILSEKVNSQPAAVLEAMSNNQKPIQLGVTIGLIEKVLKDEGLDEDDEAVVNLFLAINDVLSIQSNELISVAFIVGSFLEDSSDSDIYPLGRELKENAVSLLPQLKEVKFNTDYS